MDEWITDLLRFLRYCFPQSLDTYFPLPAGYCHLGLLPLLWSRGKSLVESVRVSTICLGSHTCWTLSCFPWGGSCTTKVGSTLSTGEIRSLVPSSDMGLSSFGSVLVQLHWHSCWVNMDGEGLLHLKRLVAPLRVTISPHSLCKCILMLNAQKDLMPNQV